MSGNPPTWDEVRGLCAEAHAGERDYAKRNWMEATEELWTLANAGGMSATDRRVCWTTYDRACVPAEHITVYADALRAFADEHGPEQERLGYVFHVGAMANDLAEISEIAEDNGWRGVAWNQTSIGDAWPDQAMNGDQHRAKVKATIVAALSSEGGIDSVVDEVMEMIESARDGDDDQVPYNVDEHGCLWLPGPDRETLR